MKKITAALLIVLCVATMAFAFGKKGVVPGVDAIAYKGLKIADDGVSLILKNNSDKSVTFEAALTFVDAKRREVGDTYISKTVIEPNGEAVLRGLYLKGDPKVCRKAETLRWTVYTNETN